MLPIVFLAFAPPAFSQSSPIDLMDLSLEELLNVHIVGRVRSDATDRDLNRNRWGTGYRYIYTRFEDYTDGSRSLSTADVLAQYPVVPNEIKQCAHVLEITYEATEDMSIVALFPYIRQSTKHVRRTGDPFTIDSSGVGDIVVQLTKTLAVKDQHHLTFNGGLSLPTGSIDERGDTPRGKNSQLPYTMQIGSGTFDLIPGLTYSGHEDAYDWGGQVKITARLGRNGRDYSLGDRLLLTAWLKAQATQSFSGIFKIAYQHWDKIQGADPVLDPTIAPVADPTRYGGERATLNLGLGFDLPGQRFSGQQLTAEWGTPFYEHLNGPQPGQEWQWSVGWRRDI
jgi:hypothetical protein